MPISLLRWELTGYDDEVATLLTPQPIVPSEF